MVVVLAALLPSLLPLLLLVGGWLRCCYLFRLAVFPFRGTLRGPLAASVFSGGVG